MANKDFWTQFEEAPSFSNDIKSSNNDEYWNQFETADFAENSENNIYDKKLFNKKLDEYLNYDGAVIENRKPYIHKPIGNTSISNYDPKNKLYNPYDPIGNFLQGLKWIAELPSKAFKETSNEIETADLEIKEMNNQILGRGFSEDDKKRLDYLNNNVSKSVTETIEKPAYKHKDPWTVLGALERLPYSAKYAYAAALKQLPILYNIGKESLTGGIGGAGIGAGAALIGGQLGPQAATPEEVITVPGGASIGFIWGSRIGAAKKSFEIEAGLARNELKQINQEIINEGGKPLSNEEINGLAIGTGVINAGLEFLSLRAILKTVPGGNEILKKLEQKQLKELARDKTIREQLSKVIKDYSNAVLTESTTEAAQEFTNIIAGKRARELGGVENTPLEQEVSRIINATKEAFAATLFLGGVGSIAQTAKIYTLQGMGRQEALEKAGNMPFDERHEFVNNNQNVLLDDIKNIPSVKELDRHIKKNEQAMQASDKIFSDLKNANLDDEYANSLSRLMGVAYANISENDVQGRSALDIYNKYNVTIKGGISKDVVSENALQKNKEASRARNTSAVTTKGLLPSSASTDIITRIKENLKPKRNTYFQSAMKKSEFDNFSDFYNSVLNNKNPKDKKQFNYLTNDGLNIRVPHDTINHEQKKHRLTAKEWENLLNNIDNVSKANISKQKSSYDGKSVLLKIKTDNNIYGIVLETFKKNNPLISTAFIDTEKNIDNWIKNEGVSSGTKTSFLNIALNNIIKDIQPDFKPKIIKSTFYQDDINSAQKEWQEQGTESNYFKNWFKNSKVVNEDGSPRVVYHGSVNTFSVFDKDRAEVTGDMGAGFYFTSSNVDASSNYEGGGPDFEQKVSILAERIMNEENIEDYKTAEDMARERLIGEPSKLNIYLSMQNPAYVGGKNKTYLFTREEYDTSDIVQEDYNSEEDYYNAVDEDLYSQFESTLYRIESAISDLLDYDDTQKVLRIVNEGFYDDGITVEELKNKLNEEYLEDYNTGNFVANEVLRRIIETLGYDGIIDETVSDRFNMGLSSDTVHYIVFNPEQIKSVNNRGTFDINNPDIYFQYDYIHNQITGEKVEIEINKDIKVNKIEPQKISSKLPFEVSGKPSDNKKALIKTLGLGNNNKIEVKNDNTNDKVFITKETVEKSISNIRRNDSNYSDKITIINNIRDIFKNSQLILSHFDTKKDTQTKIKRFANIINVNNNNYIVEIVCKKNNEILVYSIDSTNTKNNAIEKRLEKSQQHDSATYSISDIQNIFKSKLLNKYNNDIKKNGKNSDFYNPVAYEQEEHRGSISFFRDEEGNIRKTIIDLVSGKADKSTAAHEFAHLFLQTLIIESDTNLKAREMLLEVNKAFHYNGKEYTDKFHEDFARGFEAYLKSGKAPTYKLKQVFEKFKKWLKDIYLSIKYNTDIVLSPEAEQVFNKIFGNEENLEELNKKKSDILKKAKEFGQVRYKPTEEQLRYKNIAYDILSTGLRRNPNWLKSVLESGSNTRAMQKKRERIEFDLRKIQDPYSSGSGMLPEWREFFTDPGVSYENNIAGADYELAQQAYDVIINRLWERTNEEYYELQQVENEYEYILKEFKNAKNTDDRTTVLIAYYDWLESIDEIVQEQYGERWVHDTNEIERFEQLNKFEQAKEILIKNSDLLKNSNGIEEYKNVVQAVLKQLNFLTSFERNKILGVVSEITSVEELKNNIDEIMDFAETLQDVTARKNISENIQKELMATKNIRKNGKTYGKYDYSTNKMFNKLREINKLNREDAEAEYTTLLEEFEAMSEEQKESLGFEDKLYKKFVTYKAHGNVYISSDFLSSLYQDIIFAKMQGRLSKNSTDFESRLNNNAAIDKVLNRLEKKTPAKNLTKFYTKFANLESFINLFLDKKFVDEYSLLYEETQVQAKSYLEKQTVLKEIAKILNVKPFFIDDEIFKKLNEKYIFKDYSLKRPKEIELNKMQLIEAYIYSKNPIIKQRLINMFSEGGYDRIMSLLNPDDIRIGDLLQRTAEKYYTPVNQVYIKKYGIDMPKAKNYFPVAADVIQELDLFNQYTEQSTAPKFFKTRTSSVFVPIKLSNPVQTLFTHIEKANNLIILEEKLGKLNRVFKDRTVKQFISDLYGEEAYNGFIKQISDCSYTKKAEMLGAVDSMINKLVNNVIVSTISLKPKIMATQLVSVINFSDKMPSALWFGGFLKALSNPKATIKFMMENEYLQQRFGEGAQNEALARIVKASDFHKSKKFIDFFSLNVKLGDIGAIIFGGKPYVDYLMQYKKMSKEEAFKEFVLEVNRAQQAATTSSLADYQKSKNPIFRLYYAFQNTTNQYFRKTADAIISRANGDISNSEMAKTILIYTVFNNFLYRMVANPYVWILGFAAGDWEDFAKEVINSIFDLNSQALIGIGNIYQAILNAILDKPFYLTAKGLDKIPFDIHKLITESKDDLENIKLDTWLNAIGDIVDTSTGAPASTIINTGSTPANISDGQIGTAILKILGYSDYQSKKAFDIED